MKDELDREKYPRMPWHDVHCALWGPPCRDIARHFVQRWNYAKVCHILPLDALNYSSSIPIFPIGNNLDFVQIRGTKLYMRKQYHY